MKRPGFFVLLFLVVCLTAEYAVATQILYRSPQQLGQQSTLVVQGKVSGVRSYWNDTRTKVFTETFITVEQTYKGAGATTVSVVQLGGIVDNVKVTVAGALQWRPNEEVLLFLEPFPGGAYQVSGFSQGKYDVLRDQSGRAFVKGPALQDTQVLGSPTQDQLQRSSQPKDMPLDQFINRALDRK